MFFLVAIKVVVVLMENTKEFVSQPVYPQLWIQVTKIYCLPYKFLLSTEQFSGGKKVPICGGSGTNGKFEDKKRHILKELLKSLEKTYENQRKVIKLPKEYWLY